MNNAGQCWVVCVGMSFVYVYNLRESFNKSPGISPLPSFTLMHCPCDALRNVTAVHSMQCTRQEEENTCSSPNLCLPLQVLLVIPNKPDTCNTSLPAWQETASGPQEFRAVIPNRGYLCLRGYVERLWSSSINLRKIINFKLDLVRECEN